MFHPFPLNQNTITTKVSTEEEESISSPCIDSLINNKWRTPGSISSETVTCSPGGVVTPPPPVTIDSPEAKTSFRRVSTAIDDICIKFTALRIQGMKSLQCSKCGETKAIPEDDKLVCNCCNIKCNFCGEEKWFGGEDFVCESAICKLFSFCNPVCG